MNFDDNKGCLWAFIGLMAVGALLGIISRLGPGGFILMVAIGVGAWLLYQKMKTEAMFGPKEKPRGIADFKIRDDADAERAVLMVAREHDGTTSIAQIVLESALSTQQAETTLARLCKQGVAHPEFDESGFIYYRFPGLLKRGT